MMKILQENKIDFIYKNKELIFVNIWYIKN